MKRPLIYVRSAPVIRPRSRELFAQTFHPRLAGPLLLSFGARIVRVQIR